MASSLSTDTAVARIFSDVNEPACSTNSEKAVSPVPRRPRAALRALATARFAQADAEPAEVRPRLWLGSIGAANNFEGLTKKQITHVLSLGGADMLDKLRAPLHERGLKHLCVEMSDASTQDLTGHLETCLSFMATGLAEANSNDLHGGGGVFVHCFQGKSRSAGVVAAYLMRSEGLTYADALASIRLVRPRACPNLGFAVQLRRFEASCTSEGIVAPAAEERTLLSLAEENSDVQGTKDSGLDGDTWCSLNF